MDMTVAGIARRREIDGGARRGGEKSIGASGK
jgi:hypothetical protein